MDEDIFKNLPGNMAAWARFQGNERDVQRCVTMTRQNTMEWSDQNWTYEPQG